MHVLTVLDHPDSNSFSHAVAARFTEGLIEAGHTFEIADLHAEGFNPLWSMDDINQTIEQSPEDVRNEQIRIERCDAVCFVFPLFWFGMPAMTKGWLERVWTWGWAYEQLADPNLSLQKDRTAIMLIPAGARSDEIEELGHKAAMENIWCDGTLGYFGFADKRIHFLCGSTGSQKRREGLLEEAYRAGLDISPPNASAAS